MARLWTYERAPGRWYGHVDWRDGTPPWWEGPFDSEDQAVVVISRVNGLEPPEDMLRIAEARWASTNPIAQAEESR